MESGRRGGAPRPPTAVTRHHHMNLSLLPSDFLKVVERLRVDVRAVTTNPTPEAIEQLRITLLQVDAAAVDYDQDGRVEVRRTLDYIRDLQAKVAGRTMLKTVTRDANGLIVTVREEPEAKLPAPLTWEA